jgi:hypothetical protein
MKFKKYCKYMNEPDQIEGAIPDLDGNILFRFELN